MRRRRCASTICAIVIISFAADACSASSEPKSTGTGFTVSSAALIRASSERRCAGSSGGSAMPRRWRITLCSWAEFSRKCVCASDRPCDATPAFATHSASFVWSSATAMAASNSANSGAGVIIAASRPSTMARANAATRGGSGVVRTGGDLRLDRLRPRPVLGQRSVRRPSSAAIWPCTRRNCSRFISSRSRIVSHQPISVRPSVS